MNSLSNSAPSEKMDGERGWRFFWGEVGDPGGGMLTGIILGGLLQIFLVMQFCQEVNHLSLNVAHDFKGWLHP